MSRTKRFISNAASSLILQMVVLVSGFIIPRLMLVTYGSEINGLISSISQFVRQFSLVEAGLAAASIVALYKPLSQNNHSAINAIVSATRIFYFRSGYVFLALIIGCAFFYPYYIKVESVSSLQVGLLVLVLSCSGVLNFFVMAKYQALVTADQKVYVLNYLSIVSVIVNTAVIVVMTRMGVDIVTLRVVALLSVFIPPAAMHFYIKKYYAYVDYKAEPDNGALHRRWDALILQILGLINTSAPYILVTIFTSLTEVSVFTIYSMVITGAMQLLAVFGAGVGPSFGELIARGETETLRKTYNEYEFMLYSVMTLFYSCSMVMLLPFIRLYTRGITDADYNRPVVGILFVVNALLYSIKSPQGTLVSSAGLFKETKWQTVTQGAIAIVLGTVLGKYFGIAGVLVAFIVSNLYRDIDLMIYMPRVLHNTEIKTTFKRAGLVLVEFALICLPFTYVDMGVTSYLKCAEWGATVLAYGSIVILLLGLSCDRKVMFASLSRLSGVVAGGKVGR
jgi:O-antigen/teichoic acid export membrane protein